ncbi:MAG: cytochrome c oxidase subunit 3 [Aeoliella sp.]
MTSTASPAGEHHRFQAHHFDTGEQQFQAGKLGMWLFLATEVLFFSGMFCAYAVYRVNHPEVFDFAHHFLNPTLGAANTIVLLASSLSVAWAVRCAQLGKQTGMVANLVFTLICAGIFMGVKSVEYTLKFFEGLLWRSAYTFEAGSHPDLSTAHEQLHQFGLVTLGVGAAFVVVGLLVDVGLRNFRWLFLGLAPLAIIAAVICFAIGRSESAVSSAATNTQFLAFGGLAIAVAVGALITGAILLGSDKRGVRWAFFALGATILAVGGGCLAANVYTEREEDKAHHGAAASASGELHEDPHAEASAEPHAHTNGDTHNEGDSEPPTEETAPLLSGEFTEEELAYYGEGPKFPGIFFSIYYAMTGVHALHILGGIGVFIWIVYRAAAGHFEPHYYGPVEYVALYWHLVDLIWIYLFPLLYLIQ